MWLNLAELLGAIKHKHATKVEVLFTHCMFTCSGCGGWGYKSMSHGGTFTSDFHLRPNTWVIKQMTDLQTCVNYIQHYVWNKVVIWWLIGMWGLAPKKIRLAPTGTNPGLFLDQIQYILARWAKMYWIWSKKSPDLSHLWPICPPWSPNQI